jgi:curved DNA-binding protein CbpA
MEIQRCFELLDLDPNATLEEAQSAYKAQVKFFHPDRFNDDPHQREKAEEKLKEVNMAYEKVKSFISNNAAQMSASRSGPNYPTPQERPPVRSASDPKGVGAGEEVGITNFIRNLSSSFLKALRRIRFEQPLNDPVRGYDKTNSFPRAVRPSEGWGQEGGRGRGSRRGRRKGTGARRAGKGAGCRDR